METSSIMPLYDRWGVSPHAGHAPVAYAAPIWLNVNRVWSMVLPVSSPTLTPSRYIVWVLPIDDRTTWCQLLSVIAADVIGLIEPVANCPRSLRSVPT